MFFENFKKMAKDNTDFRRVVYTGTYGQLVLMSIPVAEDINQEVHPHIDQILYFVDGNGEAVISGETQKIEEHDFIFVPAGILHNVINTGDEALKLFTLYAPPQHLDRTIHKTKKDAQEEIREEEKL